MKKLLFNIVFVGAIGFAYGLACGALEEVSIEASLLRQEIIISKIKQLKKDKNR